MRAPVHLEAAAEDALWDVKDLALMLKASVSWVYKAVERDQIPCLRIGAMVRFEPAAIRSWLAARKRGPALTVTSHQSVDVSSAKKSEG